MNMSERSHFTWKIAVLILGYSFMLPLGRAQSHGTKALPTELALNVSSKDPSPERVMEPNFALIERVQAANFGAQVQVRVVGSSALSCAPFRLNDPTRLVLDCTGAHVRVDSTPKRVNLDPVVAVRVGQFKANVARIVVDLASQTPYSVRAEGNMLLVTFDPIHRQPPSLETKTARIDATATSASTEKVQAEQMAVAAVPTVPDKLPVPEPAEYTPAGFTRVGALPQYPSASAPAPAQPFAQATSEPVAVPKAVTEPTTLAARLDAILPDQDYVIGPQDLLAINVWHEPELSQSVPVRPDGKISLPLIGDLEVSGLTPSALQARLSKELDAFIHKPQVTVIVREVNSRKFYMIGEVERPGAYPLTPKMTVLDALATAGGFRDFAKVQQIYLLRLRPDGSRSRIHFDFKAAVNGKASYRDIELQVGDTVVVP